MIYDYVIVGLGKTGYSCAKYLTQINATFAITDSRFDPPGLEECRLHSPHATLSLGGFDQQLMLAAKEIVVSQGVNYHIPELEYCRQQGIPIIGDIELFARHVNAPIIAITGSNAKSTVTTLVGQMLQDAGKNVRIGGNLGTPALDLISITEPDYYVLEISNFQLETTYSLQAAVACVLNITPDHLDRYNAYEDYIAAKQRIYLGCKTAVINRDDSYTWLPAQNPAKVLSFGSDLPHDPHLGLIMEAGDIFLAQGDNKLLSVEALKIKGKHNWLNALAALAIGLQAGIPLSSMLSTLQVYSGLPHRCQWVREIAGVQWFNDSKGTNIGATIAAITGLGSAIKGKIILLAGGLGKGADFSLLQPTVAQFTRHVILFGKDAALIAASLGQDISKIHVDNFEEAVQQAYALAQTGDIVLLSPACASWDMFDNFEHRGQVFCELVQGL